MKKAKFMLLSLILISFVGAELAFNAKKSTVDWCTTDAALDSDAFKTGCPLFLQNKRIVAGPPNVYATSRDVNGSPIVGQPQCDDPTLTCEKHRMEDD